MTVDVWLQVQVRLEGGYEAHELMSGSIPRHHEASCLAGPVYTKDKMVLTIGRTLYHSK